MSSAVMASTITSDVMRISWEDRSTPRPDHGGIWNELAEGLKSHSVHDMANSWINEAKLNMQFQALRDDLEGIIGKLYHYINSTEMPLYF